MQGTVTRIEESAFGGDILTIQTSKGELQSYGFINGRNGPVLVEGDVVEFETKFFELSNTWRAIDIRMVNNPVVKKWYRLYGKMNGDKRMKPIDWSSGRFVGNLIHATIFNEDDANAVLNEANILNPDTFTFELREVKDLRGKEWY